ncbi:hypothetical protein [Sporosarcina sp. SAFN-015]|uniref:hypothetical protein n=1 Tax=Sporosarcina sp. SAFN-015 TaxID=3387274 RepID=UPI003F7D022E
MIFILLGFVVILLTATVIVSVKHYKKELVSQDWYDELYYKFQSIECPHEKHIKFSETNWKFHFTFQREKAITVQKGLVSKQIRQHHFRFFCEECRQQRWFEHSNSSAETKGLYSLRLKYLFLTGASIMLILFLTGNLFNWLLRFQ